MPYGRPKVASLEEYDSDVSSVKPGTRIEARRRKTTSGPPRSLDRYHRTVARDGASDSGYSSRTSATQGSEASAAAAADAAAMPPPRPATTNPQSRSKPVIHRSDSQNSRPVPPSRPATASTPDTLCTNPACTDPGCLTARNERRHSAGYGFPPHYMHAQYDASPIQYQASPQYTYAYPQAQPVQTPQPVPQLDPQPRPRSGSVSRQSRPVSMSDYNFAASYNAMQPGPPPSNSAYQNPMAAQWMQSPYYQLLQQQQAQQHQQAYAMPVYGATPPNQTNPSYTPLATTVPSPTSPNFSTTPALSRTYSARAAAANVSTAYEVPNARYGAPLSRTISARQAGGRTSLMPGTYPGGDQDSSETESDDEESEAEYEPNPRARPRDSRLMSSSSQRRPSMSKHYTSAPAVPTQSSREFLRRNPRSDTALEYVSSDNMDSDRTARAVLDRPRTSMTNSTRSSRRPSQSTNASGRTRSTNMSSVTSAMASMSVEDRRGRNVTYLSKQDQQRYYNEQQALKEQQRRQEASERYQEAMRGDQSPELTAENIRSFQRRSVPSVSGQSRRSSKSRGAGGGIKIESGGTTIHVYGDERVEVQTGEDGAQRVVVGGGGNSTRGGDSAYHSSKASSSSRIGRSRGGSEVNGSKKRSSRIRERREDDE